LDLLLEKHSMWLRPPHLSPLEIVDPLTPVTLSFAPPVPPPRVSRGWLFLPSQSRRASARGAVRISL